MGHLKALLNGKVKIAPLPLIKSPSKNVMKGPKRLFLEKGELSEIYDSSEPIRHIAYIEFLSGKPRGGHYHTRSEFFYIIRGEIILKVVDVATGVAAETKAKEGDLIFLQPKIAHALKSIGAGHVIEFSRKRFNPKDTIKYQDI